MKPRTYSGPIWFASLITLGILLVWGCATFETNAYRSLGVMNATVQTMMDAFADESVHGRTTPEFDAKVWSLYASYQNIKVPARMAIDGYRAGTNTEQRVNAILSQVATNKEAIRQLILSLVLSPDKKTRIQELP